MKEIDARGLACPAPVLRTRATLQDDRPGKVQVIVDNTASQQNVQRFLESEGFRTALQQRGDDYLVIGSCESAPGAQASPPEAQTADEHKRILVLCATDRLGSGDDDLGRKLMVSCLRTLSEMGPDLWRLVLVNAGVKLTIEGSEVLADLQRYAEDGLRIMVCGTCLTHYDLLERKRVGETTNMLDIVTAMQLADKVISL